MEKFNNYFKNIFIIALILIPICIFMSFIYALKGRYYLNINNQNKAYIMKMLVEDEDISTDKEIKRIGNMQGLGEWILYVEYSDGSKAEDILRDGDLHDLYMYIKQNGKLGGTNAIIVHYIFILSVGVVTIYTLYKICICINKKTDKLIEKDTEQ